MEKDVFDVLNLIFDLDGTLADFNNGGGIEKMNEKGFFRNLQPYEKGLQTVRNLWNEGNEIFVLSTCLINENCKREKMEWIAEHLPFIPKENILLINTGQVKAEEWKKFVNRDLESYDVLFDDYKENLNEWNRAGGSAVKCGQVFKPTRKYKYQLIRFKGMFDIIEDIFGGYETVPTYEDIREWQGFYN